MHDPGCEKGANMCHEHVLLAAARYERVHLNAGVGYVIKKPQSEREIGVPREDFVLCSSLYVRIKNMVESIVPELARA